MEILKTKNVNNVRFFYRTHHRLVNVVIVFGRGPPIFPIRFRAFQWELAENQHRFLR